MKTTIATLLKVSVFVTAFVSPALAEETQEPASDARVPVKHLQFSDEDIQGGALGADAELIQAIQPATHSSLIEIRHGFEVEIVKTMESL